MQSGVSRRECPGGDLTGGVQGILRPLTNSSLPPALQPSHFELISPGQVQLATLRPAVVSVGGRQFELDPSAVFVAGGVGARAESVPTPPSSGGGWGSAGGRRWSAVGR